MLERVLEKVLEKIRYKQVREGPEEGKRKAEVVEVEAGEVKRTEEEDIEGESRRIEVREGAEEGTAEDNVFRG